MAERVVDKRTGRASKATDVGVENIAEPTTSAQLPKTLGNQATQAMLRRGSAVKPGQRGPLFQKLVAFWDRGKDAPIRHLELYLKMRCYFRFDQQTWEGSAGFLALVPNLSPQDMQTTETDTFEFFRYAEAEIFKEITQKGDKRKNYADWLEFTLDERHLAIMVPSLQSQIDAQFTKTELSTMDLSSLREVENVIMHLIEEFSDKAMLGCKPEIRSDPPPEWYNDANVQSNIVAALGDIAGIFEPKLGTALKTGADVGKVAAAIKANLSAKSAYSRERLAKEIESENRGFISALASHLHDKRSVLASMVLLRMQIAHPELVSCLIAKFCRELKAVDDFVWAQIIPHQPRNSITKFVQEKVNEAFALGRP